jgi:hypothetical protein
MNILAKILAAAVVAGIVGSAVCPAAPSSTDSANSTVSGFGEIHLSAESSEIQSSAILYRVAHMVAENGATLDADEIRANLVQGGHVENAVATGHVRAHIAEATQKADYTVTSDKGIFYPKGNRIDLTGNIRAVVTSPMTTGPMVQTSDSAVIYLGKAPDYPKLVMTGNVHAVLTPAQ